jgi:hypothetical protein
LNDNAMIVDWTGSTVLSTVHGYVTTGRNGGAWNGNSGIVTSMSPAIAPNFLRTLGVADAVNVPTYGAAPTASWRGQTVDKSAVLVRYTYTGDATLDGSIDGDDYFAIDAGFPGASNYFQGNFDYTGGVNADDFFLIDANYSRSRIAAALPLAGAELPQTTEAQSITDGDALLDLLA